MRLPASPAAPRGSVDVGGGGRRRLAFRLSSLLPSLRVDGWPPRERVACSSPVPPLLSRVSRLSGRLLSRDRGRHAPDLWPARPAGDL